MSSEFAQTGEMTGYGIGSYQVAAVFVGNVTAIDETAWAVSRKTRGGS